MSLLTIVRLLLCIELINSNKEAMESGVRFNSKFYEISVQIEFKLKGARF